MIDKNQKQQALSRKKPTAGYITLCVSVFFFLMAFTTHETGADLMFGILGFFIFVAGIILTGLQGTYILMRRRQAHVRAAKQSDLVIMIKAVVYSIILFIIILLVLANRHRQF